MFLHKINKVRAPEFPLNMKWINSDSLKMKNLLGKVVLIDFWTYSCVNCLRTLPHLRDWYKKYHDKGFMIIGVHTPEFKFEKDKKNVESAIKSMKINYPVVLDNNYKIWNLYSNRWWPRKILVNAKGQIVYDHIGEGGYAETELAIQKSLKEIGADSLPEILPDMSVGGGICYRTTPETYLGFLRGRFGNAKDFIPKTENVFTDTENYEDDIVYLHGHWQIDGERMVHTKKLAYRTEYLAIKYSAFSVNCVMGINKGKSSVVEIELDGQPLPDDMIGDDVENIEGKTIIKITKHKMYNLVNADVYHKGVLKLKTKDNNIELYAFTFGGCR